MNVSNIEKKHCIREFHGHKFEDKYEWFRSCQTFRENGGNFNETPAWDFIKKQNEKVDNFSKTFQKLTERVNEKILSHILEDNVSLPSRYKDFWYYSKQNKGDDYFALYRAPVKDKNDWIAREIKHEQHLDGEQLIIDFNEFAKDFDFFSIGVSDISCDNNYYVFAYDSKGDERYSYKIINMQTGLFEADTAENIADLMFSPCGNYLFYTTFNDSWRSDKVFRHELSYSSSSAQSEDILIYNEKNEQYMVGVSKSFDEKYIYLNVEANSSSEVLYALSSNPTGDFEVITPRKDDIEYSVSILSETKILITHNSFNEDFEFELFDLSQSDLAITKRFSNIKLGDGETIAQSNDSYIIDSLSVFKSFVLFSVKKDCVNRLYWCKKEELFDDNFNLMCEINSDESPFKPIVIGDELSSVNSTLFFDYEQIGFSFIVKSFIAPEKTYYFDTNTNNFTLLKKAEVKGDFDENNYECRRIFANSDDFVNEGFNKQKENVKIPITLLYKKGTKFPAPLILTAYGAYGLSISPTFSISNLCFLDEGVICAIAHIRGGGDLGRKWYKQGKLLNKKNSFTDFMSCANRLISDSYTTFGAIFAKGGSAGGLLMGAVANLCADNSDKNIFCGIHLAVPFVDPLTSMLKPELPLTANEWTEWGNPILSKEMYDYMLSYSPYENIDNSKKYPRLFVTTSINDTRVLWIEPAKFVSKLLENSKHEVYMKTQVDAGHGGVSGRYSSIKENSFELSVALHMLKNITL